jgi:hypothetical protein
MTNGLVVMTPSSIAYSGTSASINADGSVVFSACTSLSLNGVFTSDYDNYMIVSRVSGTATSAGRIRLRLAGTDSTANVYIEQRLSAFGTTVNSARSSANAQANLFETSTSAAGKDGWSAYIFGPALAQPTAGRSVTALSFDNAYINERAFTHSESTAYDGITLLIQSGTMSGLVTVFGFNQ